MIDRSIGTAMFGSDQGTGSVMRLIPLAVALAAGAPSLAAQDTVLVRALERHRHPVSLEDGRLVGSGGALLVHDGAAARFVALGEEHGIAQIPVFAAAWFAALVPHGYSRLAVEVGPQAGRLLDSLAGHGMAALAEFQRAHPPGFPFFVLREEAGLLVAVRQALPAAREVTWGVDYDILGDRYLLDRLERSAPAGPARDSVRAVRELADAGLIRAVQEGNPGHIFLFSAPDEPFARVRAALRPAAGSDADHAIATMQETAAINRLFVTGRNWESNHRRVALIKRWFMRHYHAAQAGGDSAPRVMVKLGANHLYRGLNQARQHDVGALLAQLAESEGGSSFHLFVVGAPGGRRAQFQPQRMTYEPLPTSGFPGDPFAGLLYEDSWTLFDLRPLRPILHDNRRLTVPPALFDLVFNFDAMLVVAGAEPSVPLDGVLEALHALR
jgi:hypothetical protein